MTTTIDITSPIPQQWAIVELFGHQRVAGAVSEQTFGGSTFVRVDVPEVDAAEQHFDRDAGRYAERALRIQAHTRSFGPGAIYSINWCDEITARVAATGIKHRPISDYSVAEALANLPQSDRRKLLESATDAPEPF